MKSSELVFRAVNLAANHLTHEQQAEILVEAAKALAMSELAEALGGEIKLKIKSSYSDPIYVIGRG